MAMSPCAFVSTVPEAPRAVVHAGWSLRPPASQQKVSWWQAATGALCSVALAALNRSKRPSRARVEMKAHNNAFEEEDGPDQFFRRQQPKVRPGWNRYTSPSTVRMSNSVTFFFPNKDYRDTEYQGYVNPKLYKRIMPDKKMVARARRTTKRAWRKLSNRLQNEWRFRRYPRDESGKVNPGVFNSRRRPTYLDLKKGASRANKQ
eukprot:symbB.v1.2.003226.t1/scaffold181.1/size282934/7